jgi:IS5 family transposase
VRICQAQIRLRQSRCGSGTGAELTKKVFEAINGKLNAAGLMRREGTTTDAPMLASPPSVKNEAQARDPEMHQTKKGHRWYFGIKTHIGVDAESGLVHTVWARRR